MAFNFASETHSEEWVHNIKSDDMAPSELKERLPTMQGSKTNSHIIAWDHSFMQLF